VTPSSVRTPRTRPICAGSSTAASASPAAKVLCPPSVPPIGGEERGGSRANPHEPAATQASQAANTSPNSNSLP